MAQPMNDAGIGTNKPESAEPHDVIHEGLEWVERGVHGIMAGADLAHLMGVDVLHSLPGVAAGAGEATAMGAAISAGIGLGILAICETGPAPAAAPIPGENEHEHMSIEPGPWAPSDVDSHQTPHASAAPDDSAGVCMDPGHGHPTENESAGVSMDPPHASLAPTDGAGVCMDPGHDHPAEHESAGVSMDPHQASYASAAPVDSAGVCQDHHLGVQDMGPVDTSSHADFGPHG
jgi:hypothetical protein